MRFIADGPSIPDDLLIARDQGRVIFFCGAGVSRARANLPDFFGLAERVIAELGVPRDNAACKLIREAQEIDKRVGVSGVISADRIFGLLEREFLQRDIEAAVASALKPTKNCDLSAHNILLDLATSAKGIVRLVTTNFDRLFDDCGRCLQTWQPPRLPDPSRSSEMNGLVYLHGRATIEYSAAEGDGFVLSSSEFGRAYLADGWATSFIRQIIERYVVVFVGYAADDPPVHYLLEALNKTSGNLGRVYAFQSGDPNDAASRWRHKGVEAIAYDAANTHCALWRSLEAWADRARDSDRWHSSIVQTARRGPQYLLPHERGQIAHVVSTVEGVRKFSEGDDPPPAEWLCVFDPYRRYARPGHLGGFRQRGRYVDPFDLFGLDSDILPSKIDAEDHHAKREVPVGAWDAFALNRLDRNNLRDDNFPSIRGYLATNVPRLPQRLDQLGGWIAKVADQNAAVWWAGHQISLHRNTIDQIRFQMRKSKQDSTPKIRQAWHFLFDTWEKRKDDFDREWFELKASIATEGWNSVMVRQYAKLRRPYFEVNAPNYWGGPTPPSTDSNIGIGDLFLPDVKYPYRHNDIQIPDTWVAQTTKELRKNLELALTLETEIGGYGLSDISPIVPDVGGEGARLGRTHGLSGAVLEFSSLFARLIKLNPRSARQEFDTWLKDDDTIFARLRIWAAGQGGLLSATEFRNVIAGLGDDAFWSARHQRDLLFVLAARWIESEEESRKELERRVLAGPPRWDGEEEDSFKKRKAFLALSRITWLSNRGCGLTFDLDATTKRLLLQAPDWKPAYAEKASESLEGKTGWVRTRTEHSLLLNEPLLSTLSRARELSGRTEEFLVENDPYSGLCIDHPVRAFSALRCVAKRAEYPEWAWQTFLFSEGRKTDKPRLIGLIAESVVSYPEEAVAALIRPVSSWLLKVSRQIAGQCPSTFDRILGKLISVLRLQPKDSCSAVIRGNKEPEWTMEAINAPSGQIAQALFNDPRKDELQCGQRLPGPWLRHVDDLLALDGDLRRHAVVIFLGDLNWFYAIDPVWTEGALLSIFDCSIRYDRDAAWSGFLEGAAGLNQTLFTRLKPKLLALANESKPLRPSYSEALATITLLGWGNTNEESESFISNDEMRDSLLSGGDDFRCHILWQLERWSESDESTTSETWYALLPVLLQKAWPRQISAKSPAVSARLVDLAFSDQKRFPTMVQIILPLLTKMDRHHVMLPNFDTSRGSIIDLYPEQTLVLLDAVLSDNAANWPYDIDAIFGSIGEADERLKADERLIALKRKWDAR